MSERGERLRRVRGPLEHEPGGGRFSLATASRALNGKVTRRVRPDPAGARARGGPTSCTTSANARAQAMARGHTNIVGLVLGDIEPVLLLDRRRCHPRRGGAAARGLDGVAASGREERELDYLAALRSQRARAYGCRTASCSTGWAQEVRAWGRPAGGSRSSPAQDENDTVVVENRGGARALAGGALRARAPALRGARRPGGLLTARRSRRRRVPGGSRPRRRSRISADDVVCGFTRDGGYAAMTELLDRRLDATCVFAVGATWPWVPWPRCAREE